MVRTPRKPKKSPKTQNRESQFNITKDQRSEFGKILYNDCLRRDGRKLTQKELSTAMRKQGMKVQESVISDLMYRLDPIGYDQDAYDFLYGMFKALDSLHVPISKELATKLLEAANPDRYHIHIAEPQQKQLIARLKKELIIKLTYKTRQGLPLIGRDKKIQEILDILISGETKWLTLVGIPGVGKSELAWQIMMQERTRGDFLTPDPLSLDNVTHADEVRETISRVLEGIDRKRKILLILDECEQIADNTKAIKTIFTFIKNYPGLTILATSRVLLPSQYYEVVPLAVPKHGKESIEKLQTYDAIQLFCSSAQKIDKKFSLTEQNAPYVADLSIGLGGLPLAMLLAGSLIKQLGAKELYEALLSRKIQKLKITPKLQERQVSLDTLIAVSYDLLDMNKQRIFRRLGIFLGTGCSIQTAQAVCDLDDLSMGESDFINACIELSNHYVIKLINKRLNIAHNTLQDYAWQKLCNEKDNEKQKIDKSFADYFYRMEMNKKIKGSDYYNDYIKYYNYDDKDMYEKSIFTEIIEYDIDFQIARAFSYIEWLQFNFILNNTEKLLEKEEYLIIKKIIDNNMNYKTITDEEEYEIIECLRRVLGKFQGDGNYPYPQWNDGCMIWIYKTDRKGNKYMRQSSFGTHYGIINQYPDHGV